MSRIFEGTPHYYIDMEPYWLNLGRPKIKHGYRRWELGLWELTLQIFIVPKIYLNI